MGNIIYHELELFGRVFWSDVNEIVSIGINSGIKNFSLTKNNFSFNWLTQSRIRVFIHILIKNLEFDRNQVISHGDIFKARKNFCFGEIWLIGIYLNKNNYRDEFSGDFNLNLFEFWIIESFVSQDIQRILSFYGTLNNF